MGICKVCKSEGAFNTTSYLCRKCFVKKLKESSIELKVNPNVPVKVEQKTTQTTKTTTATTMIITMRCQIAGCRECAPVVPGRKCCDTHAIYDASPEELFRKSIDARPFERQLVGLLRKYKKQGKEARDIHLRLKVHFTKMEGTNKSLDSSKWSFIKF
jgi:hypothetical protein